MPLTIHRGADADLSPLQSKTVTVLGYGNQGRAHALNLRDSGVRVVIGQRKGRSFDLAAGDGWRPVDVPAATALGDLVVLALPDEAASEVYAAEIEPALAAGKTLGFIHGFNIRFGFIQPPPTVDVVMVAPKGPGRLLRSLFVEGKGLPSLLAVQQNATGRAKETALAWAAGIGSARAAVVETTFAVETETDLFGEQVVLCGGVSALCKAAFETLVDAGYEPEFAYLECVHELKQVVDLLYEFGLSGMRDRISGTARYGDVTRGPRLIDDGVRARMKSLLNDIRNGTFAREWIGEHRAGAHNFRRWLQSDREHPLENAGETVRSLMPWLGAKEYRNER
jgi:ketol-acid reductoisomerase